MNKYYMLHLKHKKQTGKNIKLKKEKSFCHLLFVNFMYEFYLKNNPQDIIMIYNVLQNWINKKYEESYPTAFKYIIGKVVNALPLKEKKSYIDKNKFTDFKIWNTYEYFMSQDEFNQLLSYQTLITTKTKKNIKSSLNPCFTIIIYCSEYKFLSTTINSIQNQLYDNYEIILIYDNDNQNDLRQINQLIKYYSNIQFINNQKSKGLFYSIFEGVLQSTGKYLLTIESGYTLSTESVLKILKDNISNEFDIYEIDLLINNQELIKNNSLSLYRCSHFKSEINDDSLRYNKNYKKIDQEKELIANKLFNSNFYKSLVEKIISFFDKKYYIIILMK